MMQPSSTNSNSLTNGTGNGLQKNNIRHRDGHELPPNNGNDTTSRTDAGENFQSPRSASYFCSFCRQCCTFQHFCYVVQFVTCGFVFYLIHLSLKETNTNNTDNINKQIEELQAQVEADHVEIEKLKQEVQVKQDGQIQQLHDDIEQEQQFNFLTLAGTFTLLTCLISMFHMTTHVHKFNQPNIQRKIIAILWMSPIYSVTSFLTLIFPSVDGWMAIIKDFYESYCIYVFLSFLIAVLGEGSRDKAVEVLAKHANHLDRPTRCLACFYEPPPDTSDHAKANAVMTQCQIYCLQFTLVRPLTTIFSVFVLHRNKNRPEENEEHNGDDNSNDDTYEFNNNDNTIEGDGYIDSNINSNSHNNNQNVNGTTMVEEPLAISQFDNEIDTTSATNSASDGSTDNDETRTLQDEQNKKRRHGQTQGHEDRWLQQDFSGEEEEETAGIPSNPAIESGMMVPSIAPIVGDDFLFPTFPGDDNLIPSVTMEGMPIDSSPFAPSFGANNIDTLAPTFDPIAGVVPGSENDATFSFDYNNTGVDGMFNSNTTTNFPFTISPTISPSLAGGTNDTSFDSSELVDQTKAYFKSPGFAVAMIVNISIFFAFTGLLKLYHAVREDLLWCRPFPKFLTIKAVVFLTFWQGLAILLWLILTADPLQKDQAREDAHKYQNLLICVEMLLVAISQWCVFPAIEWEPNYEPRKMHTPGLGISDFVSDVGQIVKNRSGGSHKGRRAARQKKRGGPNGTKAGMYQMPGFASIVSSQFDGFGGAPVGGARANTFDDDDFESSSFDSSFDGSVADVRDQFTIDEENGVDSRGRTISSGLPSLDPQTNRERVWSDGTGSDNSTDNEVADNDTELL